MSSAQRFWREEERALGVCAMAAGWVSRAVRVPRFFSFLFFFLSCSGLSGLVLYSFLRFFFQFVFLFVHFGWLVFLLFFHICVLILQVLSSFVFCLFSLCSSFFSFGLFDVSFIFVHFVLCSSFCSFDLFDVFVLFFFFCLSHLLPSFLFSIFLIPLFFSIVPCSFFLSSFHLPLSLLSLLTISSPLPFFIILIFFSGFGGYENMGRS